LLQTGLINHVQLATALGRQREAGEKLGSTLVQLGFVTEDAVLQCLSQQLQFSNVDFRLMKIPESVLGCVPVDTAKRFTVMPVAVQRGRVVLAMSDPGNLDVVKEIEFQIGAGVQPVVATQQSIRQAIDHYYGTSESPAPDSPEHPREPKPAAVVDPLQEEASACQELDHVEDFDALALVRLLLRTLRQKGMIDRDDFAEALRQAERGRAAA
jgi:type IV pilus assembly protein PilB